MTIYTFLNFWSFNKLKWYHHIIVFLFCFFIVVSRRIDVITCAQFWGEDGSIWFAQAYNLGILKSIFLPYTGYLQTFSRIIASFSQFIPLVLVPLFYNLSAIFIKILPVNFLLSGRFSHISKKMLPFVIFAFIYLVLPNTSEVFANVTNTHWYLSLLAFMVIVSKPAENMPGKFFDFFIIILSSLSGPFVIFLLPLSFVYWYKNKNRQKLIISVLLLFFSFMQGALIIFTANDVRSTMELGISFMSFIKIVAGQIFIASVFGYKWFVYIYDLFLNEINIWSRIVYLIVFFVGLSVMIFTLLKSKLEIKLFLIFSWLVLFASLFTPMVSLTQKQWEIMSLPGAATRYWFIPMLGFVLSLVYIACQKEYKSFRFVGLFAIILMLIGISYDWVFPKWNNLDYKNQVRTFEQVELGEEYNFFIQPEGWQMKLIKK
ncbi:MAG: hypothetical protein ABIJ23_04905 [Candidatus Magasanikbacteria bacterium]